MPETLIGFVCVFLEPQISQIHKEEYTNIEICLTLVLLPSFLPRMQHSLFNFAYYIKC
jgi:hypothetical protein